MADLVARVWMWVSISWMSNRTRESGVDRSRGMSEGLLVVRTRELANDEGENSGSRKASKSMYKGSESGSAMNG